MRGFHNAHVRALLLAATLAGASCGSGGLEDTVTVAPANVRGSVGGIVVDAVTGDPLEGVEVTLRSGAAVVTAATDMVGVFSAGDLPAGGQVQVEVNGATGPGGYTSASLGVMLPVSAGDVPLGNPAASVGPIALVPMTMDLAVQAVRSDGAPIASLALVMTVGLEWVNLTGGLVLGVGSGTYTVTTDGNGVATFNGLPNLMALPAPLTDEVVVTIPPQDTDGDGVLDVNGATAVRNVRTLPAGLIVVSVDQTDSSLDIVSSNVSSLTTAPGVSTLDPTDAVRVIFNQAVDAASLAIVVVNELGNQTVPVTPGALMGADNIVLVNPPPGDWSVGVEYNVSVHAVSADGAPPRVLDRAASFYTASSAPLTVTTARDPGIPTLIHLNFSEPVGLSSDVDWSMTGGNCVIYVNWDLNLDGNLFGTNEINGTSCNISLNGDEANPYGPAGLGGFGSDASFTIPVGLDPALPFVFSILTSRSDNTGGPLRTATGLLVPDLLDLAVN